MTACLNGQLRSARFFDSTTPLETYCAANAPYACCSQRQRSARLASTNSLGTALTTDYSRAFGLYGDKSPTSGTCPLTSCSATRLCAIWHGFGQDQHPHSSAFVASASASWPTSDQLFLNSSRTIVMPRSCRWTPPAAVVPIAN